MALEHADEIRRRYAEGGITMAQLAREYGEKYHRVWRAIRETPAPGLTPAQRVLRSRIAAYAQHAQGKTNLAPATAASKERFEKQVDPDGTLAPAERARRAELARKEWYARLSYASSKARAAHKGEDQHAQKLLTADRAGSTIEHLRRQAVYQATNKRHELGTWQPVAIDGALAERAQCRVCRAWVAITDAPPRRPPAGEVMDHDCFELQRRYRSVR